MDQARFPLVVVSYRGVISIEDHETHLRALDRVLETNRPFALLLDLTGLASLPGRAIRASQAAWLNRHRSELESRLVGISFVIESPLVQAGISAIAWMAGFRFPYSVSTTREGAEHWAQHRLEGAMTSER